MDSQPDDGRLSSYRELDVWNKAMDLVEEIYTLTKTFDESEKYGLTAQMRRSAVSIPSNIAEGYGRKDRGDYRRHLSFANGSLKELETQLIIAGRLAYKSRNEAGRAWTLMQDVGKMLYRLMASLKDR